MLIGSIAETWVPKCERVLFVRVFKPRPPISAGCARSNTLNDSLQTKQRRPVAASQAAVQGCVEAAPCSLEVSDLTRA